MKEQFTTKELQAFILLANSSSFTVAAETLHITQSALSKRIAELEAKLGVRLFDRTTRKLHLTMEGKAFEAMAISIMEHVQRSVSDLRQMAVGERGQLWMTAAPHMSSTIIPPALSAFSRANPMVNINYYDCRRSEMLHHIRSGSAEFGIIGGMVGQDHNFPAEFTITRIIRHPQYMAVGFCPGHPLETKEEVRWEDLLPYELIVLRTSGGLGHMYKVVTQNMKETLPVALEVSIINTAIGMAASGLGIVIFPSYVINSFGSHAIKSRPLFDSHLDYEFNYLHIAGHSLSGPARAFGKTMRKVLEDRA